MSNDGGTGNVLLPTATAPEEAMRTMFRIDESLN
jgi:hypothetical protein